jgi:uncharacterized protein YndB with AHSA1/START domain
MRRRYDVKAPKMNAQMLIRKPAAEVFEAFVNPDITTKFWFTKSSGRLRADARVRWEWEMFGVGSDVLVTAFEQDRRIRIEWDDPPCPVEWQFTPRGDNTTLVQVSNWGFHGSDDEVMAQAIDSKGGFTTLLAGAKAWLEHGIILNLISDQFPDGIPR